MDPMSLMKCSNIGEERRQRDRLSSLPIELLIRILSLMPTKCAVVVCLLLNKRVLIPWVTSLDFDSSPISHCVRCPIQIERFPSFRNFVDSVLQSHQSPYLTRFRLFLGDYKSKMCSGTSSFYFTYGHNEDCLPYLKSTQINSWITFPLTHYGLAELDLHIHLRPPCQTRLPPQVFTKETLQVLKLDVNLSFDGISNFRLPKLKTFHLYAFRISEDAFLTNLVSSCPVLEELKVSAWWNHVHFTKISSSSLRILFLFVHKMEEEENSDSVILDTPNLENLVYHDNLALLYSITSMPCLSKAEIDFDYGSLRVSLEMTCQQMLILMRALSNVRHLRLDGVCSWILNNIKKKKQLPVFRDLLLLKMCNVERKALLAFLYRSPNLETLVVPRGFNTLEQESCRLTLATIPWCLRYNLKRIVVYGFHGSEREMVYIEFLLEYALVLEELAVATSDLTVLESTLQNIPRASQTCSIQLHYHPPLSAYPLLH